MSPRIAHVMFRRGSLAIALGFLLASLAGPTPTSAAPLPEDAGALEAASAAQEMAPDGMDHHHPIIPIIFPRFPIIYPGFPIIVIPIFPYPHPCGSGGLLPVPPGQPGLPTPGGGTPGTPAPTATLRPMATPTPGGRAQSEQYRVCPQVDAHIPQDIEDLALAEPWRISGYGELRNPSIPYHPLWNGYRTWLSLRDTAQPYSSCNYPLWKAGCP